MNEEKSENTTVLPNTITAEQIKKLTDHLCGSLSCYNELGQIDWERIIKNTATSVGHWYINYNGILLKEKHKLAELESHLFHCRALAFNELKMQKLRYDCHADGYTWLTEGSVQFRDAHMQFKKQEAYVQMLDSLVKHISFYPKNVEYMVKTLEVKERYGF